MLAAGAQLRGRPDLARATKLGAAGAIGVSAAALVHDLGRPARFVNMLRVFKPSSPMSVGSWLLAAYGPAAGTAALCRRDRDIPGASAVAATAAACGPRPRLCAHTRRRCSATRRCRPGMTATARCRICSRVRCERGRRVRPADRTMRADGARAQARGARRGGRDHLRAVADQADRHDGRAVQIRQDRVHAARERGGDRVRSRCGIHWPTSPGGHGARRDHIARRLRHHPLRYLRRLPISARDPKYTIVPQRERVTPSEA